MRKNFGVQTWLYPMPVLIIGTYNDDGTPNAMNAAWGGIHDTNQIGVCIDPGHKTAENLKNRQYFTVSIADAAHVTECDFVGIVSGKDIPDKLESANFHAFKAEFADAPVIEELPMTIECRLVSYDDKTGCAVGEILNISADESILFEFPFAKLNAISCFCALCSSPSILVTLRLVIFEPINNKINGFLCCLSFNCNSFVQLFPYSLTAVKTCGVEFNSKFFHNLPPAVRLSWVLVLVYFPVLPIGQLLTIILTHILQCNF